MARERWISGGQKAWLCKRMNCFLKYEVNCKIDLTNCKEGTAVEGDGGGGRRRWDDGGGGAAVVVPAVEQLAGGGELEMGCGRRNIPKGRPLLPISNQQSLISPTLIPSSTISILLFEPNHPHTPTTSLPPPPLLPLATSTPLSDLLLKLKDGAVMCSIDTRRTGFGMNVHNQSAGVIEVILLQAIDSSSSMDSLAPHLPLYRFVSIRPIVHGNSQSAKRENPNRELEYCRC
ncbi:hypothetical protein E3N88_13841 [Mikania micrantha]|uniref:Uncharacterized protein n=1 Tax=Mikania micrantha TaxID=192012 RepID=A0A5N6P1F2_9ASTR|nr:hypothetical protein E3N88_13841 [Mikania micrantha]